jgi:hypothetical protein
MSPSPSLLGRDGELSLLLPELRFRGEDMSELPEPEVEVEG